MAKAGQASSLTIKRINAWDPRKTIKENADKLRLRAPYATALAKKYGLGYKVGLRGVKSHVK